MKDIEVKAVTPEEMIADLKAMLRQLEKDKYSLQVAIKTVKFTFDQEQAQVLAISPKLTQIEKAELYLSQGYLRPIEFSEDDGTVHHVVAWNPAVVGYSGFNNCVAHSLVTTNRGVYEVGRYPAVNIANFTKNWQWFIHRRIGDLPCPRCEKPLIGEKVVIQGLYEGVALVCVGCGFCEL